MQNEQRKTRVQQNTEKARLEEQAPGRKVYKLATEGMEREITPERSGQKQESLETKSPQAKVLSNAHIFQRADQVTEIMNLILAISHFSRLGSPLVVQPRPLLGGQLAQGATGNRKTFGICNSSFHCSFPGQRAGRKGSRGPCQTENSPDTQDS